MISKCSNTSCQAEANVAVALFGAACPQCGAVMNIASELGFTWGETLLVGLATLFLVTR
jgi:hypothetical protein